MLEENLDPSIIQLSDVLISVFETLCVDNW